ncbi:MAG: CDP-glycerol glycerophosphotransferase family protein [Eubacteriales bacterium]|nr:CDP-glycerol glycerophosphotransferase family protein [Eubacteriales bacterium]
MSSSLVKVLVSEAVKVATIPFRLIPIKKNRILFTGLTGGNSYDYSCNPKYLYEYLKERFPNQYEYVWAVADPQKYDFLEEEGVKLVKHFTVSSFPMLLTSKIIVTNGSYAPWFPFRKNQYVINTWHGGGAYKKVENERPDASWATKKRAEFCAKNIDLFVASCKVQEDNMIRTTFLYKGDVLRAGTPRNDKFIQGDTANMVRKVKQYYQIPEDGKIVLFAPTYRKPSKPVVLDSDYLLDALEKLNPVEGITDGGEKWYFLSRYHRYQEEGANLSVQGKSVINVADYPDMQELLCAADIMITDYSSCVWDYSFMKKPCFLYVPDKEEYIENTGFYVSVNDWPFDQATTMEELVDSIKAYRAKVAKEKMQQHLDQLGSYENGKCCQELGKLIAKQCNIKY